MSPAYRRKLVDWLTSMMVLHLFVIAWALHDWYFNVVPLLSLNPDDAGLRLQSIRFAVEIYVPVFIVIAIWHGADFIQRGQIANRWLSGFAAYRVLLVVFLLWIASAFFVQSDWLNDLGCPEVRNPPGVFTLDGCGAWTPWWKELIGIFVTLALLAVAAGKAVLALASFLKREPIHVPETTDRELGSATEGRMPV